MDGNPTKSTRETLRPNFSGGHHKERGARRSSNEFNRKNGERQATDDGEGRPSSGKSGKQQRSAGGRGHDENSTEHEGEGRHLRHQQENVDRERRTSRHADSEGQSPRRRAKNREIENEMVKLPSTEGEPPQPATEPG